ncbi:MAG: hypothetical protein M3065_10690 [Actinomycetota bacterium]|nr:hypothetical protein [Actinomycetota bacterium]
MQYGVVDELGDKQLGATELADVERPRRQILDQTASAGAGAPISGEFDLYRLEHD